MQRTALPPPPNRGVMIRSNDASEGLSMYSDARITIYRVPDPTNIPGLEEQISRLRSHTGISATTTHEPAAVGELAGKALQIVLSDPVQGIKSLAEIGLILWGIVKASKAAGKRLRIGKGLVPPLLISEAQESLKGAEVASLQDYGEPVVWGPMEVDSGHGLATHLEDDWDGATCPIGYFMAIVLPRPRERARTIWYLLSAGGTLCASWTTQTLEERLPVFLRPERPSPPV